MIIDSVRGRRLWLLGFAAFAVACFYAPGFGGFWHGDDLPNLHRAYALTQQGTLWSDTFRLFAEQGPSRGAFYRPLMMLSIALNYEFADTHYGGWYLVNFVVHVSNTLLVALIVRRLAQRYASDATLAAPLAALLFGLCPALAEGVYWVSARSDGWVTLLSLAGLYFWAGSTTSRPSPAIALPLLLVLALGFKESAAVLPLQLALVAVAWSEPLSRPQRWAVFAAFFAAALFLVWRAFLFGNAWDVYAPDAAGSVALHVKLWSALRSFGPWWAALGQATPVLSAVYLACCAAGMLLLVLAGPVPQWRLALALACGAGGLALATVLNLGAMSAQGEGGRLGYGPVAWLALAVGLFMSKPQSLPSRRSRWRSVAIVALAPAVVIGSGVLWGHLRAAWAAQADMRLLTQSIAPWAETHPGLTMLVVPANDGAVVTARGAQGGIVLGPIQKEAYLHRVLPTFSYQIKLRQEQFCGGMAVRLDILRPRFANADMLAAVMEPADTVWPEHVACWSKSQRRIVALATPPSDATCEAWLASIRTEIVNCER